MDFSFSPKTWRSGLPRERNRMPLETYAMQVVLAMVERMSARNTGSPEMLHFDYQVRAIKRQKS